MKNLETGRLLLREWIPDDANDFYEIDSNPKVAIPTGWGVHKDRKKSAKFLDILINKEYEWAIINKENNKAIGAIGLPTDGLRRSTIRSRNLVFALNENYWGCGFCPEAVNIVMKYCFEEIELEILSVNHYMYNIQSEKVIKKCGFHYDGTIRMMVKAKGNYIDNVYYSITKEEYEVLRN